MTSPLLALLLAGGMLAPQAGGPPLLAETHRALPKHGGSYRIAILDVDGDGLLDVLSGTRSLRLARGVGDGVFVDASAGVPTPGATLVDLDLGDVDGDGDPDLLFGGFRRVELWTNDGTGTFADASGGLPALALVADVTVLLDVDGDGDLDAFVAEDRFPGARVLLENDGSGAFADHSAGLPTSSSGTSALGHGDVDGDGDVDLVLGRNGPDDLWLGDGAGGFVAATGQLPVGIGDTKAALLGDMDADGDLDLVMVRGVFGFPPGPDELWINDGTGVFSPGPLLPDPGQQDAAAVLLDAEADGDLDYAVVAAATCIGCFPPPVVGGRLVLNEGAAGFTLSSGLQLLEKDGHDVVAADADADGDVDLFVASDDDDMYLNDGSGTFLLGSIHPALPNLGTVQSVDIEDFDGDGTLDAFLAASDGRNALFLGVLGLGFLDASANLPTNLDPAYDAQAGDLDADGDVDLLLTVTAARNRVLVNDGAGRFTEDPEALPHSEGLSRALALGDLDGDGDLDAFVGNQTQRDQVLVNDGRGSFTYGAPVPSSFEGYLALAAADLDLDGDVDVVGSAVEDGLLLNEGTGVFADASANLPPAPLASAAFAVGDLDDDGDPDLACVGRFSDADRLLLNDGTAVFTDGSAGYPPVTTSHAVALADLDGNGHLDVLFGSTSASAVLLLGSGSGTFTLHPEPVLRNGGDPFAFGVADLDADGDLDVLIGNYSLGGTIGAGAERLWTNLTRQVARRNVPAVGKGLHVDLRGPAGGLVLLATAGGTASIPLAWGTLRLDPLSLVLAGTFPLDSHGAATPVFPVPADPGLAGRRVFVQGLIGPPLRLSNLEELAITAY